MSAVLQPCGACGESAPAQSSFCNACGKPFMPGAVRGKILRDTNAGTGILSIGTRQLPFTLEGHWRGTAAPQVNMAVDVTFAGDELAGVAPVPDAVLAKEQLHALGGTLAGVADSVTPVARELAGKIGKHVLAAVAVVAVCWMWLPAVSLRVQALVSQNMTMFDVLAAANSVDSLNGLGASGSASSGFFGFLAVVAMLAPLATTYLRHRLAPLAMFAPLAFMLVVGVGGWLKVRGLAGNAAEGARAWGGRQAETMVQEMMSQVMKAISLGYGSYIALAAALFLAWLGMQRLARAR